MSGSVVGSDAAVVLSGRSRSAAAWLVVGLLAASVMLHGQAPQGRGPAQAPAGGPQRQGQASDEANKNKVDEVKAAQAGFVTIFDGNC
jgi:hypothetical protein